MKTKLRCIFITLVLLAGIHQTAAQGTTAFTYQGQLRDGGTNANGAYTMIFKLYDAVAAGNLIGTPITNSPTLGNGLFSVNLDFGSAFNGSARWLDITITNGGVTQTLSPRVQVLPVPYAQFAAVAATVTNGGIMNSQLAGNAVNATNIAGGQVVKSVNGLSDSITLSAGANVTVTPSGNTLIIAGTGGGGNAALATNVVSGINITNAFITNSIIAGGAIANVAITNSTFSGSANITSGFISNSTITNSTFFGNGAGLTNLQLTGTYTNLVAFNNVSNSFNGKFIGTGNGLTNVPASGIVGLLYKQPVQEATTSNLPPYGYNNAAATITGIYSASLGQLTLDGITVMAGDSVLVKNESSSAYNGIYVCTASGGNNVYTLTRRSDFNATNNLATGDMVSVIQGAANANTTWYLTTSVPITIGSTPLTFALQLPANIFNTSTGLALANGVVTNANLTANAVNAINIASGQVVKTLNGLTDFVTLTNGANTAVFTNGNALIISATVPNIKLFTSSGTFVVPTNVVRIQVETWGGGGGGGNGSAAGYSGGGGGAGGYNFGVFTVTPGTSYPVTVGSGGGIASAGGATSFSTMSASGGGGGSTATATTSGVGGSGGLNSGGLAAGLQGGAGANGDQPVPGGGLGGSVWRGGVNTSGVYGGGSGPSCGGIGGGPSSPGDNGNNGLVLIYY